MSNHKQANLFSKTHELLEDILKVELENHQAPNKKPSKATIVHELVVKHHKKVVK